VAGRFKALVLKYGKRGAAWYRHVSVG